MKNRMQLYLNFIFVF